MSSLPGLEQHPTRPRLARAEGRPLAWWGTVGLIATEGMLFALLLFSYYYLWARAAEWPPAGVEDPELVISGIRSVLLFASSATIILAERAFDHGARRRAGWWLVVTLLLAGIFLAGHVEEMIKLVEEFTWRDHAYGSIYYTVVNFHAAHLLVGFLLIGFVLVRVARGAYTPEQRTQFTVTSTYWHFVDVIWAGVYGSLYILPHLI